MEALGLLHLQFILDLAILMREMILVKGWRYVLIEKLLNLEWLHRLRPMTLSWRIASHRSSWRSMLLESTRIAAALIAGTTTVLLLLANPLRCVLVLRVMIALKRVRSMLIVCPCHVLRIIRHVLVMTLLKLIAATIRGSLASKRALISRLLLVLLVMIGILWLTLRRIVSSI